MIRSTQRKWPHLSTDAWGDVETPLPESLEQVEHVQEEPPKAGALTATLGFAFLVWLMW